MKIILSGYGKMGKEIEKQATENNYTISGVICSQTSEKDKNSLISCADVVIDFSSEDNLYNILPLVEKYKKPLVSGTTGPRINICELKERTNKSQTSVLYSENFSLGILLIRLIIKQLANNSDFLSSYDLSGVEWHHKEKKDSPSGTALALQQDIRKFLNKNINFLSIRSGYNKGEHEIIFDSEEDCIKLKHQAKTRKSFAVGAIKAASWLLNKKGFYSLEDMVKIQNSD